MSKPRIVQCLCGPARHCITALAYEPGVTVLDNLKVTETNAAGFLRRAVKIAIVDRKINPWCGICGAKREQWIFEDAALAFDSLEEARPFLKQVEDAQRETRRIFEEGKN
jgi:hypothetical protein